MHTFYAVYMHTIVFFLARRHVATEDLMDEFASRMFSSQLYSSLQALLGYWLVLFFTDFGLFHS